jgi:ribonucleotide reductase alpha subunit
VKIENPILYQIWKDRYCKNNESIEDNIHRVARYCATNEKEEQEFFDMMNDGLFFPAGRTMSNAGIGRD